MTVGTSLPSVKPVNYQINQIRGRAANHSTPGIALPRGVTTAQRAETVKQTAIYIFPDSRKECEGLLVSGGSTRYKCRDERIGLQEIDVALVRGALIQNTNRFFTG